MYCLFAYGTLMFPEVQRAVIGREPPMKEAILRGYKRLRVKGQNYPGIIESANSVVRGRLLQGLTEEELLRIDEYEGEEYERTTAIIQTAKGPVDAFVYVIKGQYRHILSDEEWQITALPPDT